MSKRNKLTPKQILFCIEYLVDLNATQAAIRAGYSNKCARQIGADNLSKVYISEHIQQLMQKRENTASKNGQDVIEELIKIGFADVTKYAEVTTLLIKLPKKKKIGKKWKDVYEHKQFVRLKDTDEWTDAAVIQELSSNKDGTLKIKLYDKKGALDSLGKHFGVVKEKHEHTGKDGGPIETTTKVIIGLPGKNPLVPHPEDKSTTKKRSNL